MQRVDDADDNLRTAIREALAVRERRRRALEDRLGYFDLRPRLRRDRERLNSASTRVVSTMLLRLNQRRQRFETAMAKLGQLNPRLVLSRGYAIVLNENAEIVRSAADAAAGTAIKILLEKDALTARVTPT